MPKKSISKTKKEEPAAAPVIEETKNPEPETETVARPAMILEPVVEEKTPVVSPVEPTVADLAVVSTEPAEPIPEEKKSQSWSILWTAVAFVLGLAAGLGLGFVIWKDGIGQTKLSAAKPVPTASVAIAAATATPVPTGIQAELNRADMKIQVLNGSGVKGTAATAKVYLESMGYRGIDTDNAPDGDYPKTQIEVKSGQELLFATLKADLAAKYVVETVMGTLSASSEWDGVVIVGKK